MVLQSTSTFFTDHWGDLASIVGLLVSLVGFAITIWGVMRSKNAAQRAKEEVQRVRHSISMLDTVMDFSAAITIMDEIKRLHRASAWPMLPDRYSTLKRILITIRSSSDSISDEYKAALQSAILTFSDIEKKVEKALSTNTSPPKVAQLNEIVSVQLDRLNEVLATIKREAGVEIHGRRQKSTADQFALEENS